MRRLFQIVSLSLIILAGCRTESLPDDPLFATRKPVESKAKAGPPLDTPDREPPPPVRTFFVNR